MKAVGPARKVVVLALHPDTWQSGPVVIPARAVAPRGFWDARHASSLGAACQHRAEAEPLSLCRDRAGITAGPWITSFRLMLVPYNIEEKRADVQLGPLCMWSVHVVPGLRGFSPAALGSSRVPKMCSEVSGLSTLSP